MNDIQTITTYAALIEMRDKIQNQIVPALLHLKCPDEELVQTLDLAQQTIDAHLKRFRVQVTEAPDEWIKLRAQAAARLEAE